MRHAILLALFLLFSSSLIGQDTYFTNNEFFEEVDALMGKYVKDGSFDYDGLSKDSRSFTDMMAKVDFADPDGWDDATKKAFFINVYNLTVIKSVLLAYPISSAEEVPGFFNEQLHTIANKKITLDALENEIIRPQYKDPRVHFALNCGARGCPEIINSAYFPATLDQQMDERTTVKLNDPNFVRFHNDKRTVLLSEIFAWFEEDFGDSKASTINFINKYREDKIPSDYKIGYYLYDWALNSTKNANALPTDLGKKKDNNRFFVSALYDRGEYELNFFNNYFHQRSDLDAPGSELRTGFLSNLFQALFGINDRLNVGFDLQFRSVSSEPDSLTNVFQATRYRNTGNIVGEGDESLGYSRTGFSRIGPKVRYVPLTSVPKLSVQHTLYFPFPSGDPLQGGGDTGTGWLDWNNTTFWTQVFYDQEIGKHFSVFGEVDFLVESLGKPTFQNEAGFYQVATPVTGILSYFPIDEITIYALAGYAPQWFHNVTEENGDFVDNGDYVPYNQLGIGFKYLWRNRWQLELLYTDFNEDRDNSTAETFNIGVRYIFRK